MSKCLALVLAAAAVHAADEVRLLKAESRVHGRYGFTWQSVSADIVVDNLAYEKDVVVWYEGEDGTWKELHAEFVRSYANTDKELWRMSQQWTVKTGAGAATGTVAAVLDLKFAVRYTVNDKIFWDTNNGANYVLAAASGELITSNVLVDYLATPKYGGSRRTLQVGVFLKNLKYDKVTKVRYSADNWASYKEASLSFQYGKYEGYSYVTYPNSNGAEYWYANIDDDSLQADHSTLRFAVSYTVNGETYWDNNYGQDYSRSY
eukprot:TRINITY_DN4958_c0_g1_i3.p1 TRINITY_DN4958_c0_g1~~TRINITY_DN4958_c0_g1_i3.p1  ORF type:complete len:262 (+),score=125.12 TRINITY_DN4958_c0_g1_i3:1247-2032(+)